MEIIMWIAFGALAGWLAAIINDDNKGLATLTNIVVGVFGALIGGFAMNLLGAGEGVNGFSVYSLLIAVVGSVILLYIRNLLIKNS
jgi:uncharacterized membrane protein YeaQ/YmgE (transglycosylase-associated protein family)